MTSREQLVEEAAKALYRNNWGDEFTFEEDRDHWVNQARAALAVFEAHVKELSTSPEHVKKDADSLHVAPTDDEREALDDIMRATDGYWPEAREVILSTFRRTVQGEPTDAIAVQNVARIIAAAACDWNHNDCGDDDHHLGHTNWGAYIDDARDALAAAVREEGR